MSLLLSFDSAARHMSFTRAATELSLTQSAVSRQVLALENMLGVELFLRSRKRIELTEIGTLYWRELRPALAQIRNATLQTLVFKQGPGNVHLAVLPTFGSKLLLPRLHEFYALHPQLQVHIHTRTGQYDQAASNLDLAIRVGDGRWTGVLVDKLFDERLIPVISPKLRQQAPRLRSKKDMSRYMLLHVATRPDAWRQWFALQGVDPHGMRLGPSFELTAHVTQAVAAGMGVALLPEVLIRDELRSGSLVAALDAPLYSGMSYYLTCSAERSALPAVSALRIWIKSLFTK
jgi:LysR family glycine cleavage system transcriptional activator